MQTKRFVAADMSRALTLVRDEMGEDAMILSTQRTSKGVEIVASVEELSSPIQSGIASNKPAFEQAQLTHSSEQAQPQIQVHPQLQPQTPKEDETHFATNRDMQVLNSQERGLASGKTKEELALELEVARRRMLKFQEQDNMTLEQWANQNKSVKKATNTSSFSSQRNSTGEPRTSKHGDQAQISQWLNEKSSDINRSIPSSVKTNPEANPNHYPENQFKNQTQDNSKEIQSLLEQQLEKDNEEIRRLHDEIASMRNLFESQLSSLAEAQDRQYQNQIDNVKPAIHEVQSAMTDVRKRLSKLGLSRACNDQVVQSLNCFEGTLTSPEIIWAESLSRLSQQIPVITEDPVAKGGTYAFLGTTGVGKTTTIAKLAARYVMEHGAEKVAVLTTDTFRIAAHDQLRSLGRILNVQVKVVDNLKDLPSILREFKQQELVLIDTPGMSYNDPLLKEHLLALRKCKGLENALVLSANSQYQMMQASMHSYRIANPRFCVMTKLDECASLGDAISLLSTNNLPMAYVTNGQAVPDDLLVVEAQQLVTKAVGLSSSALQMKQGAQDSV
jgi:flagellar biosynthesis protein FlhF